MARPVLGTSRDGPQRGAVVAPELDAIARALVDALMGALRAHLGADDWVSQNDSPLGRRAHLTAARRGDIQSRKVGKLVLVRRRAIDDYIERHPSARPFAPASSDEDEMVARALGAYGVPRTNPPRGSRRK